MQDLSRKSRKSRHKECLEFNTLQKRRRRPLSDAILGYGVIAEGKRAMLYVSGGKDSCGKLGTPPRPRRSAPVHFEPVAV